MTGINGISYLLSTIPPWYLVDGWGRRPILLSGAVAMIISLSLISYFIYVDIPATPTLTVIFVMVYNAAFGASWGPIPWFYPPEILPLSIRAKGASLSTASNWAFNWLVGEVTPVLQEAIKWRLYLVHAFFCACSFVVGKYFPAPSKSLHTHQYISLFPIPRNKWRSVGRYEHTIWRCYHCDAHACHSRRTRIVDGSWIACSLPRLAAAIWPNWNG